MVSYSVHPPQLRLQYGHHPQCTFGNWKINLAAVYFAVRKSTGMFMRWLSYTCPIALKAAVFCLLPNWAAFHFFSPFPNSLQHNITNVGGFSKVPPHMGYLLLLQAAIYFFKQTNEPFPS